MESTSPTKQQLTEPLDPATIQIILNRIKQNIAEIAVSQLLAGTGISISPSSGIGPVTVSLASSFLLAPTQDMTGLTNGFGITPTKSHITLGTIFAGVSCGSISNGTQDGEIIILSGRYTNTNTITIPTTLTNVVLNSTLGNAVLKANDTLTLIWDNGETPVPQGKWVEVSRSIA